MPPPTPNRPLKAPAAVRDHGQLDDPVAAHRRDTRRRVRRPPRAAAGGPAGRGDPLRRRRHPRADRRTTRCRGVVPEPTARRSCARARRRYGLVGCLTGRRALDARRIVGVEEIAYAGNHGFEMLRPGEARSPIGRTPAVGGRVRRAATAWFVEGLDPDRLPTAGLRLEDKGVIQALHWRGAPRRRSGAVREAQEVADLAQAAGPGAALGPQGAGDPAGRRDRQGLGGDADAARGRRRGSALFGGDDETDLDAFTRPAVDGLARTGCGRRSASASPPTSSPTASSETLGPDGRRAPRASREVLEALCSSALLRSAALDGAAGRRRGDGARHGHRRSSPTRTTTTRP